ncbi:hypothetical protein ACT3R4_14280, partial [Halomonas sp. AOP7-E1-9]
GGRVVPHHLLMKFAKRHRIEALQTTGELYMQPLSAYRQIEHPERGDKREGALEVRNLNGGVIRIKREETDEWLELGEIQSGQAVHDDPNLQSLNVYCMYCLKFEETDDPKIGQKIEERAHDGFGDTALLVFDVREFLRRVETRCQELGYGYSRATVDYIDLDSHDGTVGPLRKDLRFAHQSEFRILVGNPNRDGGPLKLVIGDISDISTIIEAERASNLIFQVVEN